MIIIESIVHCESTSKLLVERRKVCEKGYFDPVSCLRRTTVAGKTRSNVFSMKKTNFLEIQGLIYMTISAQFRKVHNYD